MKKVSVVVPCYNAVRYLKKCVEQLLCQTIGIENMEIILVDDASTDGGETWKLITEFEAQYPDTIMAVSLEQNLRQGGARNVGISYAGSEYLIFCDSDDWLLKEALERTYCAAKRYDADVVEFLAYDVYDHDLALEPVTGDRSKLVTIHTGRERREFIYHIDLCYTLASQKKLYRLSMLRENNIMFAEHLIFEEPSFTLPLRFYEKRHYFLDEKLYVYFLSHGSTMRSEWGEHRWDNPKVWMHLIQDLSERGLLQQYYEEAEGLFFNWGFGLSIKMMLQRGYVLTKEEFTFLVNMTVGLFPSVRENNYVVRMAEQSLWYRFLLTLLDLEFTDESAQAANRILRKYI